MHCALKLYATAALFGCALGMTIGRVSAQGKPADVQQLFQDLQSPQKSDRAAAKLLRIATSNEEARQFLAARLPALIEEDPAPTNSDYEQGRRPIRAVWQNSAKVAGELRIAAAVPALVKWFTVSTSPGVSLGAGEEALADTPAAMALANIGDPSVPSVQPLL